MRSENLKIPRFLKPSRTIRTRQISLSSPCYTRINCLWAKEDIHNPDAESTVPGASIARPWSNA